MTKGYKATYNYKCRGQLYEIGQEYKFDDKPIICKKGFHYCLNAADVTNFYAYVVNFKLLEIEDLSDDTITEGNKSCSNHIKVIREITDEQEILILIGFYCCFNEHGQETKFVNNNGYWQTNVYNENGRFLKTEDSTGYVCEHTYDSIGKILSRIETYPDKF